MPALNWPISTKRLVLRPHRPSDAAWMQWTYSKPAVYRFLPYGPFTLEEATQKNYQRMAHTSLDENVGRLSLVFERQGAPIGTVTMWMTDSRHRIAEIGWTVDPAFGGQGLATEAVTAVLAVVFEAHGLHRIVARIDPRNTSSANLALRVGMTLEGQLRQDFWNRGEWTDTRIFGMLAAENPLRRGSS